MLTVAYVYQMKSLQKKHIIDVQQVKAVKPNETHHLPSLISFSWPHKCRWMAGECLQQKARGEGRYMLCFRRNA